MTLDEYRRNKNWSYTELAKHLDASHATVVRRWCLDNKHKDHLYPSPKFMDRILRVTMGEVQPNDFYIDRG